MRLEFSGLTSHSVPIHIILRGSNFAIRRHGYSWSWSWNWGRGMGVGVPRFHAMVVPMSVCMLWVHMLWLLLLLLWDMLHRSSSLLITSSSASLARYTRMTLIHVPRPVNRSRCWRSGTPVVVSGPWAWAGACSSLEEHLVYGEGCFGAGRAGSGVGVWGGGGTAVS